MLRDYQYSMREQIVNSNSRNILSVLPTGAGKTVVMSDVVKTLDVPTINIAHRQELVSQISMATARAGIYHNIIAPDPVIKFIIAQHHNELGGSLYRADAKIAVAGVDTLVRRDVSSWAHKVQLWQIDEAHHVLPENKWGKAASMFPNARGIGWTATPRRSDKRALGDTFHEMFVGPSMRELINRGYLADYKIYGPAVQLDRSRLKVGSSGDFTQNSLVTETERADITGDIVEQYCKHADGKRGVTFAASVKLAEQYAEAYKASGVPAAFVDAKTPDRDRSDMIRSLRNGTLRQLTNVDIFGEGFDLPAIECVSMGRATASYSLFVQMFGRGLRPAEDKTHGIIIDHVGNVMQHGLPDTTQDWSLDGAAAKTDFDELEIPIRQCLNPSCLTVFESWTKECPACGQRPMIEGGAREPNQVEGDLTEYSQELLNKLRGEAIAAVRQPHPSVDPWIANSMKKRAGAQYALRDQIANWSGYWRDIRGASDSEIYVRFNKQFGVDIASAQSLKPKAADQLRARLIGCLLSY